MLRTSILLHLSFFFREASLNRTPKTTRFVITWKALVCGNSFTNLASKESGTFLVLAREEMPVANSAS
jgi:hypothetical protein